MFPLLCALMFAPGGIGVGFPSSQRSKPPSRECIYRWVGLARSMYDRARCYQRKEDSWLRCAALVVYLCGHSVGCGATCTTRTFATVV